MKKLVFAAALCWGSVLSAQSFTQLATDQSGDDYSHSLDVTEFASALSVNQDSIFFKISHAEQRPGDFGYMLALDTNSNPSDGKAIYQGNLYSGSPNNSMSYDLLVFVYQNAFFPPVILEVLDDSGMPTSLNFEIDTADDYSLTMKFALADIGGDEAMHIIAGVGSFDISGSGPSDVIPNTNYIELVNGTTLGVEETNVATSIYPNPAKDYITVGQRGKVEIFDITGTRRMNQMVEANQQIDLSHLPQGVYIFNQNGASIKLMKE